MTWQRTRPLRYEFGRCLPHERWRGLLELLLLTSELHPDPVLPSLSLLPHTVRTAPPEPSSLLEAGTADAVLVDARTRPVGGARPVPAIEHGGPVGRRSWRS